MALALRLDESPARVYAIMGDGEQAEGQLWEAAMAAANFKADNLTAFLDWNKVQATGRTEDVFSVPRLAEKWESFGWKVFQADGHDVEKICASIDEACAIKGRPSLIILDTVKGKAFSFAEGNAAYHNGILTKEIYAQANSELDAIGASLGGTSWK